MTRLGLLMLAAGPLFAQPAAPVNVQSLFEQNCAMCHADRAPLKQLTADAIYKSMSTGAMRMQSAALNEGAKRSIAEFLSGGKLNVAAFADAKQMPNRCSGNGR